MALRQAECPGECRHDGDTVLSLRELLPKCCTETPRGEEKPGTVKQNVGKTYLILPNPNLSRGNKEFIASYEVFGVVLIGQKHNTQITF